MKKKTAILIIIILLICAGLAIYFFNKKDKENGSLNVSFDNIKERNYNKVGNNLYYENELIETKGRGNKEAILNHYKIISNYMQNNFPYINFFIYNLNYDDLDGTIYFNGYQMINMVVIEGTNFTLAIKDNNISGDIFFSNHNFINTTIDTTNIININDAKQKALDLAKENRKEIFSSVSNKNTIQGECYIMYDENNNLCYKVVMNNGSYVKINAITGKIIDTYFFNGIYY